MYRNQIVIQFEKKNRLHKFLITFIFVFFFCVGRPAMLEKKSSVIVDESSIFNPMFLQKIILKRFLLVYRFVEQPRKILSLKHIVVIRD